MYNYYWVGCYKMLITTWIEINFKYLYYYCDKFINNKENMEMLIINVQYYFYYKIN